MALSKKWRPLLSLAPDIPVIPECSRSSIEEAKEEGFDGCWYGDNTNKGLAVLTARPWRIAAHEEPKNKWIVPVQLVGPFDFRLVAVWTSQVGASLKDNYIYQLHRAIQDNPAWFDGQPAVVCGDFNSNAIWDKSRKVGNHSAVVKFLAQHKIVSAYHHFFSEAQGRETRHTHFFWHRQDRGFHIDYVFLPQSWAESIRSVSVGLHGEWSKLSDHVPLVVELDFGSGSKQAH